MSPAEGPPRRDAPASSREARRWLEVAALVAVAAAAALALAPSERLAVARRALQAREVRASAVDSGRLTRLLRDAGLLLPRAHPAPGVAVDRPGGGEVRRPHSYSLSALDPAVLPSTRMAPPAAVAAGLRVVSLSTAEESWRWLNAEPEARGLDHEVPAYVSLFDRGELVFASGVGVRVHGGTSRSVPALRSFRLYFDRAYGAESLPMELLGWGPGSLDRLVLDKDRRRDRDWRLWETTGALAYEIARSVGAVAPRTAPALLIVNGESRGLYFLVERVDLEFLRRRYGHDDFVFLETRGEPDRYHDAEGRLLFEMMRRRLRRSRFDPRHIERGFDLDNLARWWLANTYCANRDVFQGPMVLDRRDPGARWRWVNWDMDDSFMNASRTSDAPWDQNLVRPMLHGYEDDLRRRLLTQMWRRSPSFRADVARVFTTALDSELAPTTVLERVQAYARIAADYGVEDTSYLSLLERFAQRRTEVLRAQLAAELPVGEAAVAVDE